MKVSTDGCIFGAWVASQLQSITGTALDVGTGTGLLALMVAQQAPQLRIHAVEIDIAAAEQAAINVSQSPFAKQIDVFAQSVQDFLHHAVGCYDAIFSNPPFFQYSLHSPVEQRNRARHTVALSHRELIAIAARHLLPEGHLFTLLPACSANTFILEATQYGLLLHEQQHWAAREGKAPHIALLKFGKLPCANMTVAHHYIHLPDGSYSPTMRQLLANYYLYF
ncbi:MAG: methyltransferase [Cytophagales bacterium]|nr:methyltransferase [Bernardetiaceae bacterium]MDW8204419.1 methyltransferase [Cytophagales bacterium]